MKESAESKRLLLPEGCRCISTTVCPKCGYVIPPCPHFEECLAISHKIFSMASEGQTEPKNLPQLPKEIEKMIKNAEPIDALCMWGGLLLGRMAGDWLKSQYAPRKSRRKRNKNI